MEENKSVEQPVNSAPNVNEQIENENVEKDVSGSTFGKFNDATSLLCAYNNLEKEFTRKSQKLAELSKQLEEQKTQNVQNEVEKQVQNNPNSSVNTNFDMKPQYQNISWHNSVSQFFSRHPDAKEFSKSIADLLISDKQLATSKDCLEYAYHIAKSRETKPANLNDPNYIASLAENENIKNKVINDYLAKLKDSKSNLRLISGEASAVSVTPTQSRPKNLKDASIMLKRLLQM